MSDQQDTPLDPSWSSHASGSTTTLGSIYVRWPEWAGVSAMRWDQCQRFAYILLSAADLAAEFAGGEK